MSDYYNDLFLYGKYRERTRPILTEKQREIYVLIKARISGDISLNKAIDEVKRLLSATRRYIENVVDTLRHKGWL